MKFQVGDTVRIVGRWWKPFRRDGMIVGIVPKCLNRYHVAVPTSEMLLHGWFTAEELEMRPTAYSKLVRIVRVSMGAE